MKRKTKKAFYWITMLLDQHHVPYRLSGGLAAKVYGSNGALADIDLDIDELSIPPSFFHEIDPYIIYGPERYMDESWNLWLTTLQYEGQMIDLAGTHHTSIFDVNTKRWVPFETDFNDTEELMVFRKKIRVIRKKELIAYKSKLGRKVDLLDIAAME